MIRLDTGLPPSAPSERQQARGEQDPRAWLREWEQARWNDQPRYERLAIRADAVAVAVGDGRAVPDSTNPERTSVVGEVSPTACGLDHAGGPICATTPSTMAPVTLAARQDPVFSLPLAVTLSAPRTASLLADDAMPGAPSRAVAPDVNQTDWAARSLHVHVDDNGMSVWIRDARLSMQEALQLLEKLRPGLPRVGGDAQPVRLTLNGHTVAHDGAADQPINHPNPEIFSWQSNPSA